MAIVERLNRILYSKRLWIVPSIFASLSPTLGWSGFLDDKPECAKKGTSASELRRKFCRLDDSAIQFRVFRRCEDDEIQIICDTDPSEEERQSVNQETENDAKFSSLNHSNNVRDSARMSAETGQPVLLAGVTQREVDAYTEQAKQITKAAKPTRESRSERDTSNGTTGATGATGSTSATEPEPKAETQAEKDRIKNIQGNTETIEKETADIKNSRRERLENVEATGATSDDECSTSDTLNKRFGCDGTRTTMEISKAVNILGQTAGSIATAAVGQGAQAKAQAEGSQSSAVQGAADTQRAAAYAQIAGASANAAAGVIQLVLASHHKGNAQEIRNETIGAKLTAKGISNDKTLDANAELKGDGKAIGGTGYVTGNGLAQEAIDSFKLQNYEITREVHVTDGDINAIRKQADAATNPAEKAALAQKAEALQAKQNMEKQKRAEQIADKRNTIQHEIGKHGRTAVGEQTKISKEAKVAGIMSLITAAQQGASATFAIMGADQLEEAANKLKSIEGASGAPSFVPLGNNAVGPGDVLADRTPTSITGTGEATAVEATSEEEIVRPDLGGLGDPMGGPKDASLGKEGPTPGKFTAGGGTNTPGGGGGGGLGGGGSTQAAAAENPADSQAKLADNGRGLGYESGAGGYSGGGAGGGGGSKDPDLSGLLAQFLPKKEDSDKRGNGIVDFGGRSLASDAPISLLDKNANIFERIHDTYQDKHRRGNIGM